jgi:hypothetical protein
MPWSPTAKFSHPLAAMKYDGDTDKGTANYFSFILMELLTWQGYVTFWSPKILVAVVTNIATD